MRLDQVNYPNGRQVHYDYGATAAIDDIMSRLATIGDGANVQAAYKYLGLGTIVEEDFSDIDVKLSYLDGSGNVAGLDRFGRVVDQVWEDYSGTPTAIDRYTYIYDRVGNRLSRDNERNSALGAGKGDGPEKGAGKGDRGRKRGRGRKGPEKGPEKGTSLIIARWASIISDVPFVRPQAIQSGSVTLGMERAKEGMVILDELIRERGDVDSYPFNGYTEHVMRWYVHAGSAISDKEWEALRGVAKRAATMYARDDMARDNRDKVERAYMMRVVKNPDDVQKTQ